MLTEYRARAVKKVLESFDLSKRPSYFRLRRYSKLLERAEQLPEYKARSIQDILRGLEMVKTGERIFLRRAKLRYENYREALSEPFEVLFADETGQMNVMVNPCEPYRNPRLGEAPFSLAVVLQDIRCGQELEYITFVNREKGKSLYLWSFIMRIKDHYYSGGGSGKRPQESLNKLKETLGRLFPKPAPIPG